MILSCACIAEQFSLRADCIMCRNELLPVRVYQCFLFVLLPSALNTVAEVVSYVNYRATAIAPQLYQQCMCVRVFLLAAAGLH